MTTVRDVIMEFKATPRMSNEERQVLVKVREETLEFYHAKLANVVEPERLAVVRRDIALVMLVSVQLERPHYGHEPSRIGVAIRDVAPLSVRCQ